MYCIDYTFEQFSFSTFALDVRSEQHKQKKPQFPPPHTGQAATAGVRYPVLTSQQCEPCEL